VAQKPELRLLVRSDFALKARPPGTEFLDAETGRQKSPLKCANARRDQNPGSELPEIPAETPNLASYQKCAVRTWDPMIKSRLLSLFLLMVFTNQAQFAANEVNALRPKCKPKGG
jgi:hypothetical protein